MTRRVGLSRRAVLTSGAAMLFATGSAAAAAEPSLSERISRAVAAASTRSLTPAVTERVLAAVADNLATLTFTSRAARHDHFLDRLKARGGRTEALVPGLGLRLPFEEAAAATAYLIHYAETDDSDFRAELRASPTVMGPAVALASHSGATGADLIAAIAAGYSVLGGLAAPVGPTQDEGLMSAGVWGPSASAAVAARMLRLSPDQTAHALNLAAGAAGGTFQYFYDQTEEKRLIVARAARMGVEAALLARAGEVGPRRAYEGEAGVYALLARLTGAKPDYSRVAEVIARMDGPLYLYPKFFAASSSITPSLESLAPAVAEGLRAPAVDRFVLRGDPTRLSVVASKLGKFERPATAIGAKINYAYMLAFFLTHGAADAATVAAARIDDPGVLALAARAGFEHAPGAPGEIVLHLRSGEVRRVPIVGQAPGSIAPLAPELRRAKLMALAAPALGPTAPDRLQAIAGRLQSAPSAARWVGEVQALIAPRARA